ncbi:asparagine synthase (glutamine-hydrolyzing) [bacterium]|jgi:asparagine synthase (glutamine-hydrolysing)|nr:asparagine synthase (glutamine-hydrolyzing) [bacterium]MBT4251269.1 asparagine synthase (glutamine-hydrolyzing) [bacterium]MBT4598350.1 asparagine synthase (glutamine-hydrolyzing) [bacterium]MBT6754183.1 asparagine synthase (glutamine-hydrolyzing) [bacterium]MBT7037241.1 asparagine synthase (glutamine-hydrolyzing) [bacterium]
MCGINGIVKLDKNKVSEKEISLMNKEIQYRGPDDQGIFTHEGVGFGHVRLSIIDLSSKGHQPMEYAHQNRKIEIVFNGEIYNFQKIKGELQGKGYVFNSTSDTEVLGAAYLEFGFDCVKKFNGMFAFVIYDRRKNILFGARDRFGKKPLKYYLDKDKFIFSSELKAILTQGVKREVDFEAINDYLTLQYVPAPRTGFRNIFKLPHASYFTLDLSSRKMEIKKYWNLDYSKKLKLPESELIEKIEEKFEESVKRRMIADVEIGAFLSGGVDSSAIVAFASKFKKQLKTFTIKFNEKDFDESEFAKKVAKRYGTDHREFLVEPADMKSIIKKLIRQYEEPYADSSQLPTYILAQKTSAFVTVALNGDGGDENFGGYDKYEKHLAIPFLKMMPCKKVLAAKLFQISKQKESFLLYKIALFVELLDEAPVRQHFNFTHYFDIFYKNDFYKNEYQKRFEKIQYDSFDKFKKEGEFKGLDQILYLDFNTYVPDDLMVKVDIATMANGLESRSPILDYEFVELCAQIRINQKIDIFGRRKKIFKKMLEKYLDKDILYRKKKGFSVPIKYWFRNELKDELEEAIFDKKGLVLKMMKEEKIKELFDSHQNGQNHSKKLWSLMSLNLWHREYFLNK